METFSNILSKIKNEIKDKLVEVDKIILEKTHSDITLIPEISKHIIFSGGKRIRPTLTLLSSQMFSYKGTKDILLAACVEFIHTATLLHDDVVDESDSRRNVLTSNSLWGNKPSVLVGDFLFTKSFELMVSVESLDILGVLSKTSSILAQGEIIQLSMLNDLDLTTEQYINIIISKTASLFTASMQVGAMLAATSASNIENIKKYATNLGIVYQIIDDVLDYSSSSTVLGKNIGTDFKEGKITLPIILTLYACTSKERQFFIRTFKDLIQRDEDLEEALYYINKYNALEQSVNFTKPFLDDALTALNNISVNNKYTQVASSLLLSSIKRIS